MVFYTVKTKEQREIGIKKSKFIATAFPISSLNDVRKKIDEIKSEFRNATHYPYALRIGHERIVEKFSDDGEPPRSSGIPILQELKNSNITNVLLVVARYFGGIKLGLGGLSRAYRESAKRVLDAAIKLRSLPTVRFELSIRRAFVGKIWNILESFNSKIIQENYGKKVEYSVEIEKERKKEFLEALKTVTKGEINIREVSSTNYENGVLT